MVRPRFAATGEEGRERMGTIRRVAAVIGALALPMLAVTGCTSNPLLPTEVLFLQVYDLEIGAGREAKAGDRVVIDYIVWAFDSEQPDSKGQELNTRNAYTFFLGANQVNPAFDQGIVGMRIGGLRRLVIPASYARPGSGFGSVPPNTPLVAEVRLVDAQAVG